LPIYIQDELQTAKNYFFMWLTNNAADNKIGNEGMKHVAKA